MTLIKLHYHRATPDEKRGEVVYINPKYIVSISEFGEGSCVETVTDIEDGKGYFIQETPEQIIKRIEAAKGIIYPWDSKEVKMMNIEQLKEWCKEQADLYESEMDTANKSDDEEYYKYCEGMQYAYWSVYDKIVTEEHKKGGLKND